jgi:hypothetical protein
MHMTNKQWDLMQQGIESRRPSRERVTADDLELAATWLESYESDEGDDAAEAMEAVAALLRKEAYARREAATVRQLVKETGATPARARQALRDAQGNR